MSQKYSNFGPWLYIFKNKQKNTFSVDVLNVLGMLFLQVTPEQDNGFIIGRSNFNWAKVVFFFRSKDPIYVNRVLTIKWPELQKLFSSTEKMDFDRVIKLSTYWKNDLKIVSILSFDQCKFNYPTIIHKYTWDNKCWWKLQIFYC